MSGKTPQQQGLDRREIPQRSTSWATRGADVMARMGLTPNQISVASVIISILGAAALLGTAHVGDGARAALLVTAAACAPLRLLFNMLDGMLAVEKGMHSPVGDLYNELPDRLADLFFLAAAGYAVTPAHDLGPTLGWIAASLAVLTAYVRSLGGSNGVGLFFDGPMAKPRRMWVLVIACLLSLAEPLLDWPRGSVLGVALVVIALGSLVTVVVRLRLIAAAMKARA